MRKAPSASLLDDLCRLSRLQLDDDRRQELGHRLDAVMDSFAALREVPATPTDSPAMQTPCPLRGDEPAPPLAQETALANAARTAGGCFLVPRVVEG